MLQENYTYLVTVSGNLYKQQKLIKMEKRKGKLETTD